MILSNGQKFRQAMEKEKPLQLVGVINAYAALLAKSVGFQALYLSGASIANISFGVPDIGITTFKDVFEEAKRILSAVDMPLIVDLDTGFCDEQSLKKTIQSLEILGVAGIHLEDQIKDKKCGHLPKKQLISKDEMSAKIEMASNARKDKNFVIIARSDALHVEGIDQTLERALLYKKAGADMFFLEAAEKIDEYQYFKKQLQIPILANLTEFGKTPLFTLEELQKADVDIALYPLSASRAMQQAALLVYQDIRKNGSQKNSIQKMQTREELYHFLNYKV